MCVARTAFEAYKVSQPEDRGVLLDRYRLTDVAFKVVGIGSVGTFCALGLFTDRDGATLLLQLKEAQQFGAGAVCRTERLRQSGTACGDRAAHHAG